jgi:hypothetical protein
MFVPSNVFDEPMHENYNTLCCGSRAVRASVELRTLRTNQPGLRVSRHDLQRRRELWIELYIVLTNLDPNLDREHMQFIAVITVF